MVAVRLPPRAALGLGAVAVVAVGALVLTVPSERTLAMVFEADGQIDTATSYLVDWDRHHPLDYAARLHTADLQLLTVHPDQAVATLQAMSRDFPDDRQVLQRLVEVDDSLLMVDETLAPLEQLARVAPGDVAVLHRLADLYRWKAMTEPLLGALRRIVAVEDAPDERAELVDILLSHGRYDDLVAWLRPVVAHAPATLDLRLALYEAYVRTGRFDDAATEIKEVLALSPERVDLLRPVAEHLLARGLVDAAVALYRERIDREPVHARRFQAELDDLLASHAEDLAADGRSDDAIALYRRRIAQAPTDVPLRLALSELYGKREADVAIAELEQLLRRAPDSLDGWIALAERYSWKERLGDAVAAYRQALKLSPHNRALERALAQHLLWSDRAAEAIAVYEHLIAEAGDPADREALVELLIDQDRGAEALAEADKLDARPRHRYLRALALHAAGDDAQALPVLLEWTRAQGGDLTAWQAIEECATELDQPDLALAAMRRVRALERHRPKGDE